MDVGDLVFVGTLTRQVPYYSNVRGEGLLVYAFSEATAELTLLSKTGGIDNPTYLCLHPNKDCLYAVSEVVGWNEGVVTAYAFERGSGELKYLGKQATLGANTNYVATDISGAHVIVANYAHEPWSADCPEVEIPGEAVAVLPLEAGGRLLPPSSSAKHNGPLSGPPRQDRPHPHCVEPSPDGRYVVIPDLGLDRIYTYHLGQGQLRPAAQPFVSAPKGSGPRHFIFRKDGRSGYVVDEIASSVSQYDFDVADGSLVLRDTVSAIPGDYTQLNSSADIHLSPDERFLYVSNRGHDSIAIFKVDDDTGRLELSETVDCGGRIPRNFAITSSGRFVIVANQGSDLLVVFERDAATGSLRRRGETRVGTPMCVKTLPRDS